MATGEKITKDERSPLVRDMDFGVVSGIEENKNDVPRFATIEYNRDTNQKIYEDYTNLDNFLEKEFIPKKIKIKKYKTSADKNDIDIVAWIAYHEIQKLRLSEDEIKYVFKFLEERDIYVRGINSTLDFNNYDYISTYKTFKYPETVDWSIQLEWFKQNQELRATLQDKKAILDLRNKIVETNLRLVPFVAYKFSIKYGFDIDHLNSCGTIGLINAVEKFDYNKGCKFSTYAYKAILRTMLKEYAYELGFKNFVQYADVRDAVEVITEFYEENGIDREIAIDEVVTLLRQAGYNADSAFNMANNYVGTNDLNDGKYSEESDDVISYGDEFDFEKTTTINKNETLISGEPIDKSLIFSLSRKAIEEKMEKLNSQEKYVIERRFGFYDGIVHVLEEIANEMNLSRERVRQIEKKALRKLATCFNNYMGYIHRDCIFAGSKYKESSEFRSYLELIDEMDQEIHKI